MLSLIKLAKEGKLEKTGAKPKLPIKVDGVSSETLDVYKIPLDYLYYNDKNGRIATGISQYEGELHPANDQDDPNYNIFVEKLIEQDNTNALKRTTNSIKESGQQVYGYVLDDGRIVDGNRRFTALRDIHRTTGKTVYFEAVVLPFSYNNSTERVKIKKLELAIQMGVKERQSYDPVDLAVDIYQTTGGEAPIMTQADYAADSHMRPTEVKKYYDGAVYMRKFLEFIGTSKNKYNILKESKVWSLFYEMGKSLSKNFGDDPESQVRKKDDREKMIDNFRTGNAQVLVSNPNTLGESISLHQTVHDAVYFEYNFNLTFMLQSRDRINRLGLPQNQYTRYYYLMTKGDVAHMGFIGSTVYRKLKDKEKVMLDAIDGQLLAPEYTDDYLQEVKDIVLGRYK